MQGSNRYRAAAGAVVASLMLAACFGSGRDGDTDGSGGERA